MQTSTMTQFDENQLRAAIAVVIRSRDHALDQAIALAIECERLRARIAELEADKSEGRREES